MDDFMAGRAPAIGVVLNGILDSRTDLPHDESMMCPNQTPPSADLSAKEEELPAGLGMIQGPGLTVPTIVTDFTAEDYQERLYERYAGWQQKTPVFRNQDGIVYFTRYEDCALLISDGRFGRRADHGSPNSLVTTAQEAGALHSTIANWMIFMDPPRHPVVRRAFSQALNARLAGLTDAAMRTMARQLLGDAGNGDPVDFLSGLAGRLPALVICHIMGVPDAESADLGPWAFQVASALDSGEEAGMRAAEPAATALCDYFRRFVTSDAARGPGGFVRELLESDAGPDLSDAELIDGCVFLLVAGHETTRNMIANSVLGLLQNPDQMQLLRAEPGLLKSAIDELLRYTGPLQKLSRWTKEDVTIGGYAIPRGTLVVAMVGAANRDPAFYADPHKLDIRRSPNSHLAFGRGNHSCIGRPLAVRETSAALEELLRTSGGIEVVEHRWSQNASMRSLDSLVLRWKQPSGEVR
jgi:cytochrome P450